MAFTAWREFDPEETVRFYALLLSDAKLIKKTPQEIISAATDLALGRGLLRLRLHLRRTLRRAQ